MNVPALTCYDAFGRLVSSRFAMGGATRTLGHQYDEAGNRTQLTYPGGQAMTYGYDAAGQLTGLYEGTGTSTPRATGHGLSMRTFGGSTITGSRIEAILSATIWCPRCIGQ